MVDTAGSIGAFGLSGLGLSGCSGFRPPRRTLAGAERIAGPWLVCGAAGGELHPSESRCRATGKL